MAQLRQIKKRMVAVGTIRRITKTMQMIATAKFTAAMSRAKATRPYVERIRTMVAEVAAAAGDVTHPLLSPPRAATGRHLVLVLSSDRGLCGAYNGHILRTAMQQVRQIQADGGTVALETSGKKAVAFFRFAKLPIDKRHAFGDRPKYDDVEVLAERYMKEFTAGQVDSVRVVFMRFISNSRQVPEVMQLLPLSMPATAEGGAKAGGGLYEFSPSSEELLGELLPRSVKVSLFQAFMDAVVSENVMRMVAMKAASDNANGLGRSLRRSYNRARQAKITTELTEIVSGAAALD